MGEEYLEKGRTLTVRGAHLVLTVTPTTSGSTSSVGRLWKTPTIARASTSPAPEHLTGSLNAIARLLPVVFCLQAGYGIPEIGIQEWKDADIS